MIAPFIYSATKVRVIFGLESLASLEKEAELLGLERVLVISTPGQALLAQQAASQLGGRCAGTCNEAKMHVPIDAVKQALKQVSHLSIDGLVAIGGGSSIGLAKAVALETELPITAIPTTYSGSEMTPIYGITENGVKKTGKASHVQPQVVIYDPHLTLNLPSDVSITSGINAIAHAVEGLYAKDTNPVVNLMAEEGIRALATGLPAIYRHPGDIEARTQCLYGAWLCGIVLGSVGMALHHKLCHTLGGSFNLPHAETHTVILPYVIAYNRLAAPDSMRRIARALAVDDPARGIYDLAKANGAKVSLQALGMKKTDLESALHLALQNPYWNPQVIESESLEYLLLAAFNGDHP